MAGRQRKVPPPKLSRAPHVTTAAGSSSAGCSEGAELMTTKVFLSDLGAQKCPLKLQLTALLDGSLMIANHFWLASILENVTSKSVSGRKRGCNARTTYGRPKVLLELLN